MNETNQGVQERIALLLGALDDLTQGVTSLTERIESVKEAIAGAAGIPGAAAELSVSVLEQEKKFYEVRDFKGVLVAESDITITSTPTIVDAPEPFFVFWVTNKGSYSFDLGINGTRQSKVISAGEQFGIQIPSKVIRRIEMACDSGNTTTVEYYGMY